MECPSHINLANPDGIKEYLRLFSGTIPSFLSSPDNVSVLSGGTANFIFRLHFPHSPGRASTAILKHSTNYVASAPSIAFDLSRWGLEKQSLRTIPSTPPVYVPEVFYSDSTNHIIIMADIQTAVFGPESVQSMTSSSLKELLTSHDPLSRTVAIDIGRSLACFLKSLHTYGLDPKIKAEFENKVTRQMCAWRTWTRLPSILESSKTTTADEGAYLTNLCGKIFNDIVTDNTTVTMGDYWPGNILIRLKNTKQDLDTIFVVDWELTHPGSPAADVGQLSAEVFLSGRFTPENRQAAEELLEAFHREYIQGGVPGLKAGDRFARDVMVYTGGHVAGFLQLAGWTTDDEKVKKYIRKGVNMMLAGAQGEGNGSDLGEDARTFSGLAL